MEQKKTQSVHFHIFSEKTFNYKLKSEHDNTCW